MALNARSYDIAVGDLEPAVQMTVKQKHTNAVKDLTTASTVHFYLRDESDGTMKVNAVAAAFVVKADGTIKYAWIADDTDTVGEYLGWFVIDKDTRPYTTTSVEITIREAYKRGSE